MSRLNLAVRRHSGLALVIAVGLVVRSWAIHTSDYGNLNADEAVTGLGGLRLFRGEVSIVIPGNSYTSNLESYVLAPVIRLGGGSIVLLKTLAVCGWAIGCLMLVRAARFVVSAQAAFLAGALAWMAPGGLAVLSTRAYLAYPWGFASVATAMYLTFRALEHAPVVRRSATAGFAVGLALYMHPMYLMCLAPFTVAAAWPHRRMVRSWWVPAAGGAFLANLPFIAWNLAHGFPSLTDPATYGGTYAGRFARFFSQLLPVGFGLRAQGFRSPGAFALGPILGPALGLLLAALVVWGARELARRGPLCRSITWTVVLVWPLMALLSALGYTSDGRYSVIPMPMLVIAAVAGGQCVAERLSSGRAAYGWVKWGAVAWVLLLVLPVSLRRWGRDLVEPNAALGEVVLLLESSDFSAVAGGYWEVLPVMYASGADIEGAVLFDGPSRYPESQRSVEGRPQNEVAFVFRDVNEDPSRLWLPASRYRRDVVGNFVVYRPIGTS